MTGVRWTLVLICFGLPQLLADELTFLPDRDTTIFEESDDLSNGSGDFLFSGRTAGKRGTSVRRLLLGFDLSPVPEGVTITSAALELRVNKVPSRQVSNDMGLHRLTKEFGQGSSNASGQEGTGTDALDGDATWSDAILDVSSWDEPGGDFEVTPSSVASVGIRGSYTWDSTELLVSDVQSWLDTPETNFGWILIGDEDTSRTAKRFGSAEGPTADRPRLTIEFDAASLLGDFDGDGTLNVPDISLLCEAIASGTGDDFDLNEDGKVSLEDLSVWVSDLANSIEGDTNLDGSVAFDDFLALSGRFGQQGDWSHGDFDCSGDVGFSDFLQLSQNFGTTVAQAASLANVPEPSAGCLIAVALLGGLRQRRGLRA